MKCGLLILQNGGAKYELYFMEILLFQWYEEEEKTY